MLKLLNSPFPTKPEDEICLLLYRYWISRLNVPGALWECSGSVGRKRWAQPHARTPAIGGAERTVGGKVDLATQRTDLLDVISRARPTVGKHTHEMALTNKMSNFKKGTKPYGLTEPPPVKQYICLDEHNTGCPPILMVKYHTHKYT